MAKKAYIGIGGVARKVKKGYVGVENFVPRALPSGYTQVEYIESSGTQYVDTGVKPNQNTKVVVDVQFSQFPTGHSTLFGSNDNTNACWAYYRYSDSQYRCIHGGSTQRRIAFADPTKRVVVKLESGLYSVGENQISFDEVAFSNNLNMYLFALNRNNELYYPSSHKMYSCEIYDGETLLRDYVPCISPSGTAGLYDMVNGEFVTNAGTGLFATGATYKGIARKIKKAYIGIGGVARPCWSGGELAYYGTITALSLSRGDLAATTVGDCALFGGGTYSGSTMSNAVDAYTSSLVRSTPAKLGSARKQLTATTNGNYALFGGGYQSSVSEYVDSYDLSLTHTAPNGLSKARRHLAATPVGDYALFGGGYAGTVQNGSIVDTYNTSLTRGTATALSSPRHALAATTIGNYALFGGGVNRSSGNYSIEVDAYNASLTKSATPALSQPKSSLAATTVGDYALFGGGDDGYDEGILTAVDVYDKSLTHSIAVMPLTIGRRGLAATTVEGFAIFAGGYNFITGDDYRTEVDVYDESLTKTTMSLQKSRYLLAGASVGNYALFAGGIGEGSAYLDTVEAFTVA